MLFRKSWYLVIGVAFVCSVGCDSDPSNGSNGSGQSDSLGDIQIVQDVSDSAGDSGATPDINSDADEISQTADSTVDDSLGAQDSVDNGPDGVVEQDPDTTQPDVDVTQSAALPEFLGNDRPAKYKLPKTWTPNGQLPLVVLLHGYSATAGIQDFYLGLSSHIDTLGFILVLPEGTINSNGEQFWNATEYCCDFENTGVDDVAYLSALVDEAIDVLGADPTRVYIIGHSNGGFMSYRLACDIGEKIAAIVSIAGATFKLDNKCKTKAPTAVLQVHGTKDDTISYNGDLGIPSAKKTTELWATRNQCQTGPTPGEPLDLEFELDGAETETQWWTDCAGGADVGLWTIVGGSHIPTFTADFIPMALDFLYAHRIVPPQL